MTHNREVYEILNQRDLHELRIYLERRYPNSAYCVQWFTDMWLMAHSIYSSRAKDLQQPLWLVYLEAHKVEVKNRGEAIMRHRQRAQ